MCGIYGFIGKGKDPKKILNTFIQLGIETESRGKHATGYYAINSTVHTEKAPMPASDFYFDCDDFNSLYEEFPTIMIGHNRYATVGDPKINKNNHPFTDDRFGFIHNGCCKGWVKPEELGIKDQLVSECDSEWIFRFLTKTFEAHHGNMFSTIKKTISTFDDASVACALVDSKHKKLWLFRNVGNPICYIKNEELDVIFFASTPYILKEALEAEDLPTKGIIEIEGGVIVRINEDLELNSDKVATIREKRSSYLTSAINSWVKKPIPKTIKKPVVKNDANGFKCLVCGKKFISIQYVEKHLSDVHKMNEDDLEDFWTNLNPKSTTGYPLLLPFSKESLQTAEKKVILKRPPTKIYTSFDDMQKETDEILKKLEAIY